MIKIRNKKNSTGFTLIELLVVISIIGLLASVVLASLNTARARSRDARRLADIKQLQLALELYYNDNGAYPIGGWIHSQQDTWKNNTNWLGAALVPKYIASLPRDSINTPSGAGYANQQFVYSMYANGYGGPGQWYMIIFELEDEGHAAQTTDGVRTCNGTIFHYGNGSNGIMSVGGSC